MAQSEPTAQPALLEQEAQAERLAPIRQVPVAKKKADSADLVATAKAVTQA